MSERIFFEISLKSADFTFGSCDGIEEPLQEALLQAGVGEVTGGGSGMGGANVDVEVTDPKRDLELLREVLQRLAVAPSTVIQHYSHQKISNPVYVRNA